MDKRIEFSLRITRLRKESGCTPNQFAEMLGIKYATYYTYENGRAVPSFDSLIQIAEKCNVSLDWLCGISFNRASTESKTDAVTMLERLLAASQAGQKIEVTISCPGISRQQPSETIS